jgi:hypothetical protein
LLKDLRFRHEKGVGKEEFGGRFEEMRRHTRFPVGEATLRNGKFSALRSKREEAKTRRN